MKNMQPLPTIYAISDLHLDTGPFEWPEAALAADVIVVAGDLANGEFDIDFLTKPGKPLVFVPGNHDFWTKSGKTDMYELFARMKEKAAGTSVHVLWDESVVIQGVRFLGTPLWTNFGGLNEALVSAALRHARDYRYINAKGWYAEVGNMALYRELCHKLDMSVDLEACAEGVFSPLVSYALHQKSVSWLDDVLMEPFEGPTVLVTHMAPTYQCLSKSGILGEEWLDSSRWRLRGFDNQELAQVATYASDLGNLFRRHRDVIDLAIHGHVHGSTDLVFHHTRVVANPRGRYYGPLSEKSKDSSIFFPMHFTADEVNRSQERFVQYPYWGDNPDFSPQKIVRIEDGLAPALQPSVDKAVLQLAKLLEEMRELKPFVGHRNPIIKRSIQESVRCRSAEFESILTSVLRQAGEAFDILNARNHGALNLFHAMHLDGMTKSVVPHFDSFFKERIDPFECMDNAVLGMSQALELLPKLPFAAALALEQAKAKVSAVEEFLHTKGVASGVKGAVNRPFWRTIPFELGTVEVKDETTERLTEQVDLLLTQGRMPRTFSINVDEKALAPKLLPGGW